MAIKVSDLRRRQLDDVREDRDRWRALAESAQRLITGRDHRFARELVTQELGIIHTA